jgi:hypothetical protein
MADDDDCIAPLRSGVRTFDGDDSVSYRWALYSRTAVEAWLGRALDLVPDAKVAELPDTVQVLHARRAADLANTLTGWAYHYGGAGRFFSDVPCLRVVRGKILVTQRCGLDI